jgi:amidophosphoribosyltransferase
VKDAEVDECMGMPASVTEPFGFGDDKLHEECGVFGVFNHPEAAALTAIGLHALQHRGQEAAGIVTFDGQQFHSERRLGLVGDHFNQKSIIDNLPGPMAIGHVRYATVGATALRNVQPLFADLDVGGLALCHNGNLTNALSIRRELVASGAIFQSTSDTEVIVHLIARSRERKDGLTGRIYDALQQIEGAYALGVLTRKRLIGIRDRLGIRPLILGKLGNATILASETCALDIIGARFLREVENGEVVVISDEGIESHRAFPRCRPRPCIFEYIYFARPDSIMGGHCVYDVRKAFGRELAQEAPADADVIIPVPDSGVPAAVGYAHESGLPFELGIIRNHYVGRTFIEPEQRIRKLGVKLKHNPTPSVSVEGKRIVLIDDSIVRGTTSTKIVQMMRDRGAKEVHMRIACPPIKYADYYGIDTPDARSLLAGNHDVDGMRRVLGCDSLAFLSVDGTYRALGYKKRDPDYPQFTDHCFTGEYPTPLQDWDGPEPGQQHRLSLMA